MMTTNSHHPKVSIVIPTLNAERFLGECLESVKDQHLFDYEVVIVDGGSEDGTIGIAESFSTVRVVRQRSKGLAGAWNEGVENAEGAFIAFLDSDDVLQPNTIAYHLGQLAQAPEKMASIGQVEFFLDQPGNIPVGFQPHLLDAPHLAYMPGCFLGRREVFDIFGLFETRWVILSDIVWFDRLKARPDLVATGDRVVLRKRVHGGNLSYTTASETPTYKRELLQYMREKVQAGRAAGHQRSGIDNAKKDG